jgi:hypothetical protein
MATIIYRFEGRPRLVLVLADASARVEQLAA